MCRFSIAVLLVVPLGALTAKGPELPPADQRMKASMLVVDVYGAEANKAKTAQDKARLAARVRETAVSEKDPASRWAMLDFARDLAAQAGEAKLVGDIIAEMNSAFGNATQALAVSIEALLKSGRASYDMVDILLMGVDAALEKNDFAAASKAAEGGVGIANKMRDANAAKYFTFIQKKSADLTKKYAAVKDNSDDLARFTFVDKQDISGGIALLAKASDSKLANAAKKDAGADILSGSEMSEVGDAWMQLGDSNTGDDKVPFLMAALSAYSKAQPNLTGLEKAKCENRIKQIMEAIETQESKNGLFIMFTGRWVYDAPDLLNAEFKVHRSGRVLMDIPNSRLYLTRSGKSVTLQQPKALSRWTVQGDSLTIEFVNAAGKPLNTINATRKP